MKTTILLGVVTLAIFLLSVYLGVTQKTNEEYTAARFYGVVSVVFAIGTVIAGLGWVQGWLR